MTITDVKTIFRNYLMLVETNNEQKHHISGYFQSHRIRTTKTPLKSADYTFLIFPNHITGPELIWFGDKFLIERKSGHIDSGGGYKELRSNLTVGHKQFNAEFERMKDVENVILLLENTTEPKDIWRVPRGKLKEGQFIKTYNTWINRRNEERKKPIQVEHCYLPFAGEKVMLLIKDYLIKNY